MLALIPYLLAVLAIYYLWRLYRSHYDGREHTLRERVAYMLWTAAEESENDVLV